MSQWISQHGYLIAVFVIVLIVFIFVLNKAAKAYTSHYSKVNAQRKELEKLTGIKNKFRSITPQELDQCSDGEILEGFALLYQIDMQKSEDMQEFFRSMSKEKQYVYTLDVFVSDGKAEVFFSENGEILTEVILEALENVGMKDFARELSVIQKMFSSEDESVSYNKQQIENFDKWLTDNNILSEIKSASAKYIKDNYNILKI